MSSIRSVHVALFFAGFIACAPAPEDDGAVNLDAAPLNGSYWDSGDPEVDGYAHEMCSCMYETMLASGITKSKLDVMLKDMDGALGLEKEARRNYKAELEVKYADLEERFSGMRNVANYPCARRLKDKKDSLAMDPDNDHLFFLVARTLKLKCIPARAMTAMDDEKP